MYQVSDLKLAIIGLGYVGLPLAIEFSKKRSVIGFDIDSKRINDLENGIDRTLEVNSDELSNQKNLEFTSDYKKIENCNCYIITVPTPIDHLKRPDTTYLESATRLVANVLSENDLVIYESTVYPGLTEEFCVPIIEELSKFKLNISFFCGYSPERINPGDQKHKLTDIVKVTSGSNEEASLLVDNLYKEIIRAGTYRVESIRVAEAAKVIENTQRDINIALINELSMIFSKMGIDTEQVLKAAETKWNFLSFRPGLVGGHCIGVDPYYLTFKAQSLGHNPKIILAGRDINEGMTSHVLKQMEKKMFGLNLKIEEANILILGLSFKENCPDIRNSKVISIYKELKKLCNIVDVYDPWVTDKNAINKYNINLIKKIEKKNFYDAILVCVGHRNFIEMGSKKIRSFGKDKHILFDLKYIFSKSESDLRL